MGPLLQLKRESNIEIRAPAPQLRDKLTEKFERYPNVTFASEIRLKVPYAYPDNSASEQSSLSKYQVLVWEIDRTIKIPRFTPHNNKLAA
jgi:hypothetical protein